MNKESWVAVQEEDSGELLGYISKELSAWKAMTIFGYVLGRVESKGKAESMVRNDGRAALAGLWRYQDSDHDWYACVIQEAYEDRVVVVRTNELGIQEPALYKRLTLKEPNETNFVKA